MISMPTQISTMSGVVQAMSVPPYSQRFATASAAACNFNEATLAFAVTARSMIFCADYCRLFPDLESGASRRALVPRTRGQLHINPRSAVYPVGNADAAAKRLYPLPHANQTTPLAALAR